MTAIGPDADLIYEALVEALPGVAQLPDDLWLVGGCIRDVILGRSPRDVDCAAPRAVDAAAAFAQKTGGRNVCLARQPLQTWRVVLRGLDWDFTDIDGDSIDADLARRDYTIGTLALFVGVPHQLRDPFGGVADLEARIVRMVSSANLVSDPLRMIRAVRFSGRLGFDIDPETLAFIAENADELRRSAPERITAELDEIVWARDVRRALDLLVQSRLDREVFEIEIDEAARTRCASIVSQDVITRYAALFADCKDRVESHAERARWSGERRRGVTAVLEFANRVAAEGGSTEASLAVLVHDYGTRCARRSAELIAAVGDSDTATRLSALVRTRGAAIENLCPLLDGREIREILCIEEGPEIGRLLRQLTEAQIRRTVRTRAEAEELVRREYGAVRE